MLCSWIPTRKSLTPNLESCPTFPHVSAALTESTNFSSGFSSSCSGCGWNRLGCWSSCSCYSCRKCWKRLAGSQPSGHSHCQHPRLAASFSFSYFFPSRWPFSFRHSIQTSRTCHPNQNAFKTRHPAQTQRLLGKSGRSHCRGMYYLGPTARFESPVLK